MFKIIWKKIGEVRIGVRLFNFRVSWFFYYFNDVVLYFRELGFLLIWVMVLIEN